MFGEEDLFQKLATGEITLEDRLQLLRKSGQINDQVLEETKEVTRIIEEKYKIELTEKREGDAMFVTHVAIALQRLVDGEQINETSSFVMNEVKKYPEEFEFAKQIAKTVEGKLGVKVPEAEVAFIAAYLCILHGKTELPK